MSLAFNQYHAVTITVVGEKRDNFQNYLVSFRAFHLFLQRNLCTKDHSTIIQNKHKMEATQIFFSGQWLNKPWYIYMYVEYYSAVKRDRWSVHATMWMNLKKIMLCEKNQSPKAAYYNCLYRSWNNKIGHREQLSGCQRLMMGVSDWCP